MTEELELMEKKIKYEDFPPSWEFCLNSQCPRHETCVRWVSSSVLPPDKLTATCVLPAAASMDTCPFYKLYREVRTAWGFTGFFKNVKVCDSKNLRARMMEMLGSRAAYYRYNSGYYKLTPEQQENIIALWKENGYNDHLEFDNYTDSIDI